MIAALSAADQRRRRTDPVETATPRSSHFASLLPSNITITRSSPLLQAKQASQPLPLKKGARTPLTVNATPRAAQRRCQRHEQQRREFILRRMVARVVNVGKDRQNRFHARCLLNQGTLLRIHVRSIGKWFFLCAIRLGRMSCFPTSAVHDEAGHCKIDRSGSV